MAAAAASLRASSGAAHNGEAVAHALHGGYASALDALLRNRAVRDFLAVFPEAQWERAVKLTLLYGISALRAHYRHSQLTLPFLEGQCSALAALALSLLTARWLASSRAAAPRRCGAGCRRRCA
jgi:hypothetical protein